MIPLLLTGPAGSGKTFRCLAEIAAHLREAPEGAPLILLAPRQATYQLERQILSAPGVDGFTRLRILSFQRLSDFVFEATGRARPKLLEEQGRVMVLRALLGKLRGKLEVYGKSAHREGLAQELSLLWRELCEHGVGPHGLEEAAGRVQNPRLAAKLRDLALIFGGYVGWLETQALRDGDELLDLAADAALAGPLPKMAEFWLDGFAQMTPQERRLLNATLCSCESATLAFCLPRRPLRESDCFSMWGVMSRLYCQMRDELAQIFGAVKEETLERRAAEGRFARPALAHLEERWGSPCSFEGASECLRVVKAANLEAEAIFTAREILKFVRAGGRFREAAVLARSLDGAQDTIRRVFHRYGIKFFMDRRESVAHHPLAELTRGALRTICFGFKAQHLFAALKSGLVGIKEGELDWFENMALARGWNGEDWRGQLKCGPKSAPWEQPRAESICKAAVRPIFQLQRKLGAAPGGREVAAALRWFWAELGVERQLNEWAEQAHEPLHSTVWTQMDEWLKSIETAFGEEAMPLGEWLGIVEAGLASLTVGLIPPALDQTLVGAVDRSRNPDLKAVFLLGVNEGLFPKPGKERLLLNDSERVALDEAGVRLGMTSIWNLGAEQFYGYIACTRAREALTVTFSQTAADGSPLNPSLFISQLRRLFPKMAVEEFSAPRWEEAEVAHELNAEIFRSARMGLASPLEGWPVLSEAWQRARSAVVPGAEKLSAGMVAALYGTSLRSSVSKLEQFAMCPFRFFVASGLHAEERLLFELDRREEGSFQHEILAEFHKRVREMGKRWRDVSPTEARGLVAKIAGELSLSFQDGLVEATPSNRFKAEAKTAALQEYLAVYLQLMRDYQFDPRHVELAFGPAGPLPVWVLKIDEERALEFSGRIDRVDVWVDESARVCYAAIFDYKSSKRQLDRALVQESIQQQLPAYLAALRGMGGVEQFPFPIRPAGAFYVNLRLKFKSAKNREDANSSEEGQFRQSGVFDSALRDFLDPKETRELFDYNIREGKSEILKALKTTEFENLLVETEERLRTLGRRIFEGDVRMEPYLHKKKTPCDQCFYAGICRIDPWTHEFRKL